MSLYEKGIKMKKTKISDLTDVELIKLYDQLFGCELVCNSFLFDIFYQRRKKIQAEMARRNIDFKSINFSIIDWEETVKEDKSPQ